jgi:CHAT domain-containing protein
VKTTFVSFQQGVEIFMNATTRSNSLPEPSAVILAGSFTDIEKASAGAAAGLPSELRLSPVAADREGEMKIRLHVGRLVAFLRRHPALHGAAWGVGIATFLVLAFVQLRARFDDPLQRLQLAHRPFEARLTGFAYAPWRATRADNSEWAGSTAVARARTDLQEALEAERSPENLRRAAAADLATGNASSARALLEEAHRLQPKDASILSDLAAAELADHRIGAAAEHSARAMELDPMHAEAAFTWAMAMEQFSNRPAAIDAWRRYLIIDPDRGWAVEARAHLDALEEPRATWAEERNALVPGADAATIRRLVAKYPYHTRLRVLNVLMPEWARRGDAQVFALMRAMAQERAARDPYLLDCVEHAASHREAVVPGILKFQEGLSAYDAGDFDRAFVSFSEAEQIYDAAHSPLAIIAAVFAASMNAYAGRTDESLARAARIETRLISANDRYPSMLGDTVWLRGLVQQRTGFPGLALENYRRAAAALHRSGETEQEIAAQQLIATALDYHGDPLDAEQVRIAALRASESISADRDRMFGAYADTTYTALRSGRPRLARAFAYAQMAVAEEQYEVIARATTGSVAERERQLAGARELRERWGADADVRRALALLDIGRAGEAEQSIASARTRAMSIASAGYRDRVLAEIDFTTGLVAQRRNQVRASIAAFTSAIELWNRQQFRLHTASGYLARAEAYRTSGDRAAAERDYRAGIEDFEAQRDGLEPDLRVAHFERAERLFERLISLLLEAGRDADALTIAERKRARVLLDQVAAGDAAIPLDAEQIREALPKGRALLEITTLDASVESWLVFDGRITHARAAASRQEIEDAVGRQLAAIDGGDPSALRQNGRWLYDTLLASLVSALPIDTNVVVVADGVVQTLPFATLITPDDRYVIERFALPTAPSASVLLRQMPRHEYSSLLSVAEPQPGDLPRLHAAAAEAQSAAEQQPHSRYAAGAAIGPNEFLSEAGNRSCVHFAGHARTDVEHPSRSALLFESTSGPADELTASRIGSSRLQSAPLVVLAACSTGRGKLRRNEGIQSLAAAFLQAGARGVVATLWDVEDVRSAKLFRSFHLQLREGARPADALRSAQRALLRSNDPRDRSPSIWASAVVEGTF